MKKLIFLSIISVLLSSNFIFSGNTPNCGHSNNPKCNFLTKRLSKKFTLVDLKELCRRHSEAALNLYNMALENLTDLENQIPHEVLSLVRYYRDHSFIIFNYKDSLTKQCAQKIAMENLCNLPYNEQQLIHALRSIAFHIRTNECYDPKLAKFLIRIYLDLDYAPSKKRLSKCLCTAAFLGDTMAVQLLLSIEANPNFVNTCDNFYTPLAYALIQEHGYAKIKNKSRDITLLIKLYEHIAAMLIKEGARADHEIINGLSDCPINRTYLFMQTSNINIFKLFETQIADKIEDADGLGCNIVMNAFKLGNAEFIKYLYANPLYKNSSNARTSYKVTSLTSFAPEYRSFMNLAFKYYKHHDFRKLFNYLIENNEAQSTEENNLKTFAFSCLWNAIQALDYQCIKGLMLSRIPLHVVYDDQRTCLIACIMRAKSYSGKKNLIKIIELFAPFGTAFFSHKDNQGKTALDYARKEEEIERDKRMKESIRSLNSNSNNQDIAEEKEDKSIKALDNNIMQALVMTPLLFDLKTNNQKVDLLELIYKIKNEHGSDVFSYKDSEGKTALDYAEESNLDCSIIEALKEFIIPNFE